MFTKPNVETITYIYIYICIPTPDFQHLIESIKKNTSATVIEILMIYKYLFIERSTYLI